MEHFKRLAFCMLYLFTFIWQLSAQVKKIPQWGAVRDSVARYCQRNFISDVAGDNINKKPLLLQWFFSCRNEATRTPDPYVPNVVRYQLWQKPIGNLHSIHCFLHQLHDRIDICLLCSLDRYMFHILPYLLFS